VVRVKRTRPPGKKQLVLRRRLRAEHFTKREVLEFGKLWRKYAPPTGGKPRYVPTLQALVDDRRELWARLDRRAKDMGWGAQKKAAEWKAEVGRLYKGMSRKHTGNFFVTKDVHGNKIPLRLNPWALYDAKYDDLPDEDKWDTPRSSRKPGQTGVAFRAERRYKEKRLREDIRFLEDEIRRTGDPSSRLETQLLQLQYNLKTGSF